MNYYNEHDPHAAQWLRNLIAAGHVPFGYVDERSIEDVEPSELAGYTQCHFFAGIGGWSLALRLVGWPADRPVWTGSCPCQPFSAAGAGAGFADERHLWPAWFHLIEQCRPVTVFGEQVEAAIRHDWLDLVHADLEGAGYTVGAACLPAAAVGAPHQRQRLWWVAHAPSKGRCWWEPPARGSEEPRRSGEIGSMADTERNGGRAVEPERGSEGRTTDGRHHPWTDLEWLQCSDGGAPRNPGHAAQRDTNGLDDTECAGLEGYRPDQGQGGRVGEARSTAEAGALDALADANRVQPQQPTRQRARPGETEGGGACGEPSGLGVANPWANLEWLQCSDRKGRPTQSGLFPRAYGVPGRVGRLRAFGNAIVPQVGAAFVAAYLGLKP